MQTVKNFFSRKFLLAAVAAGAFFSHKQYDQAIAVVLGYISLQTGLDVHAISKAARAHVDAVDAAVQAAPVPAEPSSSVGPDQAA